MAVHGLEHIVLKSSVICIKAFSTVGHIQLQPVIAVDVASAENELVIHAADTTGASGIKVQSG